MDERLLLELYGHYDFRFHMPSEFLKETDWPSQFPARVRS
jgi:hypothetical protein